MIDKLKFYIVLSIINTFLCGTHFFGIKRYLLNLIRIKVGHGTRIVGPIIINYHCSLVIGDNTWIGRNLVVDGNGYVKIENCCDIAPNLLISTGSHEIGNEERRAGKGITFNSTLIESGCWIGTNVVIINGSKIGKKSIVGACSLVNKNISQNSFVAGVPASLKKELN
ncbi:MAG: acyltransferase [Firmicutes bacterium]|nr:acyltransferase [Bacillota bacterium]